jgi:hypothetical protein
MLIHNAEVTGSLKINNVPFNSGSFSGSFRGDGSQLTGIDTDPFPYTGSAIISGSLNVIGNLLQNGSPIESDPFPYTGSAIISGSLTVTGSLNVSGGVTGSFTGSFVGNGSGLTGVANATTASYIELSNVNGSASLSTRLTGLESFSSSLDTIYATDAELNAATASLSSSLGSSISANSASISSLQVASGSFSTRVTSLESFSSSLDTIYATDAQLNAATASLSSSLASNIALKLNISETASFAKTSINNSFVGTQEFVNITATGTASFGYIESVTGSAKIIGDAFIVLNNDTPAERYAGIIVVDSGSINTTASLQFDGQTNDWFYEYTSASITDHAVVLFGPEYSTIGNPTYLTDNKLPKATDRHHLIDSNISDNGTTISLGSNTQVTGSFAVITGSVIELQVTNTGVNIGNALTDAHNVTGSLGVTGSFTVTTTGTELQVTNTGVNIGNAITDNHNVTGSLRVSGSLAVTGSVGFAYEAVSPAAWSAGGALSTARCSLAGAGTQNEGLAFGGSSPTTVSCTEEYNGSSWSSGGALITARFYLAGAGTQNAGLAFGGDPGYLSCTEEYDGSTWTAGGALITARRQLAGTGTQNAGLTFGGYNYPLFGGDCTEEYNGTSWSTGGALSVGRYLLAGAGTQNAGLAFGGIGGYACTEEYNGTSWSAGGALITSRAALAGSGTQNAGLAFGGNIPTVSCTEEYNGTSWTAGGALIIARDNLAGAGIQTAGLAFGGFSPLGILSCTEEYSQGIVTTKTFDYSSTTGNLSATGSFTGSFRGDGSSLTGLPAGYSVTNSSDNRIITSVNSTSGNAEANLTFDGTVLNITGNVTSSGGFSGNLSGNASTSTILQTARTIGGVSFNGSANINLPGVNTSGNQNTSGNAATATSAATLTTARTIGGVSFDGSANINLPGVNTAGNQDTSGTATNATNFNVEADDSTNAAHFIIFTGGATGNQRPNSDSALTYNPSTNLLSAGCFVETSALRCKDNIHPISFPLDKVKQLKPVTFDWKHSGKNDIGFIAEEVKEVLPNLIHYNEEGEVEGMNYSKVTSLLVAAIQEQQEQINELKQEINNLKNK